MKSYKQILIVAIILMSGLAFAPALAFDRSGLDWTRFAASYEPPPAEWFSNGPEGGSVMAIAISPTADVLYAGTVAAVIIQERGDATTWTNDGLVQNTSPDLGD